MSSLFGQLGRTGHVNVVVVTTQTGGTIKGVLVDRRRDGLILRAASTLGTGPNNEAIWTKAIGEIVIPMANVDYFQQLLPLEVLD